MVEESANDIGPEGLGLNCRIERAEVNKQRAAVPRTAALDLRRVVATVSPSTASLFPDIPCPWRQGFFGLDKVLHVALQFELVVARLRRRRRRRRLVGRNLH